MRSCLQRCPDCHAAGQEDVQPVPGEGPRDARVMFVFEQPGKFENNVLRPMVGKTGQELDQLYLGLAGLSRSEVWVDNIVKCKFADSGETPPDSVVGSCAEFHLRPILEKLNPEFLVLSGGLANSLWPSPLSIDATHGYWERDVQIWGWRGTVVRIYHPALGMYIPAKMKNLIDDFSALRYILRGEVEPPIDSCPKPQFYRLKTAAQVRTVLEAEDDFEVMAIDTESKKVWKGWVSTIRYIKYCIQFCIGEGEAFLIMVSDEEAIAEFAKHVNRWRHLILWNAPHDMRVMQSMGIDADWDKVIDAMSLSYIDGRSPKGLKAASFQLITSAMTSFEDLVRPYGVKAAMEYFERASNIEWSKPVPQPTGKLGERNCAACKGKTAIAVGKGKAKKWVECKVCGGSGRETTVKMSRKKGIGEKVDLLIRAYLKDTSNPEFDPWERWVNWPEEQVEELMAKLGPVPLASVELVPEKELETYACADANNTRRLYPVLMKRLAEIGRIVR